MKRFDDSDREHLFWWSPPRRGFLRRRRENAGDRLSPVVVQGVLDGYGLRIADKRRNTGRLLAIGSILHFAREGDVVWGSGVNGKIPAERHRFRQLDVRAVRGPLTREFLERRGIGCPEVYGDPALLLPQLFPDFRKYRTAARDLVVIPHLHDAVRHGATGVERRHLLWPTTAWPFFVQHILESRLVLSASLHGLIVAEAFGIPARMLRLSEHETLFKYEDYYLGTGRGTFRYASSVAEGVELGGEPLPEFDSRALLDAFPRDLWTG